MAKIDLRLLPCLCILYLLAFLDRLAFRTPLHDISMMHADLSCRVNISNAAILGLKEDLNLEQGTKFNTALTIFFVPYIICEIPSNILLKKLKPHVWCMSQSRLFFFCQYS